MKRVFADTSYFIATIAPNDVAHLRAQALAEQRMKLVTTTWVMGELGAYLSKPVNRGLFVALLRSLRSHPNVTFIPATQDQFDTGAELYEFRGDKEWSLVDCISFTVMRREGLEEVLTTDHHFAQAGFRSLLGV
jgi:uncharacterized protein